MKMTAQKQAAMYWARRRRLRRIDSVPPFTPAGTGWTVTNADGTHTVTFGYNSVAIVCNNLSPLLTITLPNALVIGKSYRVTVSCLSFTAGSVISTSFTGNPVLANAAGTISFVAVASSTSFIMVPNTAVTNLTLGEVSIQPA